MILILVILKFGALFYIVSIIVHFYTGFNFEKKGIIFAIFEFNALFYIVSIMVHFYTGFNFEKKLYLFLPSFNLVLYFI